MILLTVLHNLTGITASQLVAPLFLASGALFIVMVILMVVVLKRLNAALEQQRDHAREIEQQENQV